MKIRKDSYNLLFVEFVQVVILLFSAGILNAAFEGLGVGARALGLAGAYTALCDDAQSMYWNPAGLGLIEERELTGMYSRLYPDLEDSLSLSFLGYAQPVFRLSGAEGTSSLFKAGISAIIFGSELYSERMYGITVSNRIGELIGSPGSLFQNIAIGFSLKYLSKAYGQNGYTALDPAFTRGYVAAGYSYDAGALYKGEKLSIGIAGRNINQPDIHITKRDIVPAEYRLGTGYRIFDTQITLDGGLLTNRQGDMDLALGAERWLIEKTAAVRAGYDYGNNDYSRFALGASYVQRLGRDTSIQIDYSFQQDMSGGMDDFGGTHNISTTVRF